MRTYVHNLNEAAAVFDRQVIARQEVYAVLGNYIQLVRSLEEAKKVFDAKEVMYHTLSPITIGALKHSIGPMRDDIVVFRFAYGSMDGFSDWKRTQTYKQWVKEQRGIKPCQSSKKVKSNISTSAHSSASSET